MEVNLAIDQGNSAAKVAMFDGQTLLWAKRYDRLSPDDIRRLTRGQSVRGAIYSSVSHTQAGLRDTLQSTAATTVELDHLTPMPMAIEYATPETLGHDRIAAAAGALEACQGQDCVVIDAGTALTLDTVTADGRYRGGNISPGLNMRLEALHHYTSRLPKVSPEGQTPLIGSDTQTAIRSGVEIGLACEIDGYIQRVTDLSGKEPAVIVTGGDCHTVAALMKTPAMVDENLVMRGLNRILLYNENI